MKTEKSSDSMTSGLLRDLRIPRWAPVLTVTVGILSVIISIFKHNFGSAIIFLGSTIMIIISFQSLLFGRISKRLENLERNSNKN